MGSILINMSDLIEKIELMQSDAVEYVRLSIDGDEYSQELEITGKDAEIGEYISYGSIGETEEDF